MIKDRMELKGFEKIKIPEIHGHVKLQLRNVFSGNVEKEIEGDNIVTNAVKDIFGDNICGAVNYNSMLPLWSNWYRGVLCYKYAHDTDLQGNLSADNYYPKDSTTNPVTAHAGDSVPSETTDDLTRGQPSATQTLTNNSVTIGWEWGASQGNGDISAISLCHKDTGNAGLGSTSQAFQAFQPLLDITDTGIIPNVQPTFDNTVFARYDDANGLEFYLGDESDYGERAQSFESNKITVFIKKLLYGKSGLLQTATATKTYARTFTVTIPFNMYTTPAYYFDESTKYLWCFSNSTGLASSSWVGNQYSTSTVKYFVIDCANGSLVNLGTAQSPEYYKTIVSDTSNLAPLGWSMNTPYAWDNFGRRCLTNIIKQGNYVYLPTSSGASPQTGAPQMNWTGLKKINLADTSEQYSIAFGSTVVYPTCEGFNGKNNIEVMSGMVSNGATGFACAKILQEVTDSQDALNMCSWAFSTPDRPVSLVVPIGNGNSSPYGTSAKPRYILANKMLNTTLFNLPSTVTKGNNQSMSITYTLTEV